MSNTKSPKKNALDAVVLQLARRRVELTRLHTGFKHWVAVKQGLEPEIICHRVSMANGVVAVAY